jgi:CheY-like chemotaxis protein
VESLARGRIALSEHFAAESAVVHRDPGGCVPKIQHSRSRRSEAFPVSRTRVPVRVERGNWRRRSHHRPDPGGGAGTGGRIESAPSILLADDEGAIRTICRVNLETDGMSVVEAADGREALERVRRRQPDLVLLDVMMPQVDGWQVAADLAADATTSDIPVIFLSARATREDKVRAQELGAVGYIVKPFDPVGLGAAVRDTLERIRRGEREQLNRELFHAE